MITGELADFLSGQIDVHIGTRDAELRPHSARVSAIRVEDDGEHDLKGVPERWRLYRVVNEPGG